MSIESILRQAKGRPLLGELRLPGDKSISHRALLLASLAVGASCLRSLGTGHDVRSTAACLRQLGVSIAGDRTSVTVRGRLEGDTLSGPLFVEPAAPLDCGNSGTTMRLLLGLLAGSPGFAVLTGDRSLSARPMLRVTGPLATMGGRFWGREDASLPPLAVLGTSLCAAPHQIAVASAQVKSALLLAGLRAEGLTSVTGPAASRDHTERMLAAMGAEISQPDPHTVAIHGPARLQPLDLVVPGDPSSAAFWIAAALLVPGSHITLCGVSLNPGRLGLVRVLQRSGARIKLRPTGSAAGEPVGDLEVRASELRAITVEPDDVPALIDEIPLLGLLATAASGESRLSGLAELRHKETDRLACLVQGLRALGATADEQGDDIILTGPSPLRAPVTPLASEGDHRMAMTWAVAALVATGETAIHDGAAVAVSYPAFWSDLVQLTGGPRT